MDQDDSIMSTPSSHPDDIDDSLLPETTTASTDPIRAQTPQNDHLNAAAPGELSPPRSQTQTQTHITVSRDRNMNDNNDDEGFGDEMPGTADSRTGAGTGKDNNVEGGVGGGAGEWRAGMWKSKKAQDEMQKVWDTNFVDRDFSLSMFGDVLGHKIGGQGDGKQAQVKS